MKKDQKKPVIQESAERENLPFSEETENKTPRKELPAMVGAARLQRLAQKPKSFRLDLDEKQAKQVHDFMHNNFIGAVADPIIEKFRLKNPPVAMNSNDLREAMRWLDLNNTGMIRIPIAQMISKFIKEDLQEEESSENQTAKSN